MNKWLRIFIKLVVIVFLVTISVVLVSNYLVKEKVVHFLETSLPDTILQTNSSIELNVFSGTISFNNPIIEIRNLDSKNYHTKASFDKIVVEDISYWDYFLNSKIHIDGVKFIKPNIVYFKDEYKKIDSSAAVLKMHSPFIIDELNINNAKLHIYDRSKDSLLLYVENGTININDININKETIIKRLPVAFKNYQFKADSIFVKANPFENLTTSNIISKNNTTHIKNIRFKTKYSRQVLSSFIKTERDHFDLVIDGMKVSTLDFGFINRKLFVKTNRIEISNSKLNIFRNKLITDDSSIKKLYSESLRAIPFNLTIDSVKIKNTNISYTEKVKEENDGGRIEFQNLDANIANVSNTYKSPAQTTLDISGYFMRNTAFNANWSFDVNNTNDDFIFKMNMKTLEFSKINKFTEPNLKIRFNGEVKKLYFTINGNKTNSIVDLKVNYEDFKILILNKKGKQKNWFLTKIVNLFVSKDSKDKSNNFRKAITEVDRDKTKSIFNFIWVNVSHGLLKSMAGDGDKN